MTDVSLINLVALIILSLIAVAGALNANAGIKRTLFLVIFVLCIATAVYDFMTYNKGKTAALTVPPVVTDTVKVEESLENNLSAYDSAKQEDSVAALAAASVETTETEVVPAADVTAYKTSVLTILNKALKLNGQLANHNLTPETDEEYEQLRGVAMQFYSEILAVKTSYKKISAPAELQDVHQKAEQGLDALIAASTKLNRFYKAENGDEEKQFTDEFQQNLKRAKARIQKSISELQ
jgi:hypothetical protein